MINKEKIKNGLLITLMVILLLPGIYFVPKLLMDLDNYIDNSIRYREWEKFKESFEKETEQFGAKTFENLQLHQGMEEKNPLPLELRRERFVVFSETMKLQKKYLTDQEYAVFCLLYRDMQERKLDSGEVKLMMYFISKVLNNATPEELAILEEGHELEKKIDEYYAQVEASAKDKK